MHKRHKYCNDITISGGIIRDVVVKTVGSGSKVSRMAFFDIGMDNLRGKKLKTSYYFHCVAWDSVADRLMGTLKGTEILINKGYLSHSVYKAKDGRTHNNIQIVVEDFAIIEKGKTDEEIMEKEIEQAEDFDF